MLTIVDVVHERRMVCKHEMVAGRAVTNSPGPAVIRWSHSLAQSGFGRTLLHPDWSRGQNRVLEVTEMEERWMVREGQEEERMDQAREKTGEGEG